ncbi:MAG: MFS transporter [Intrasporangiaceae bacterium]|nr:MFS transporter [Intrasporangiaceae bacterium]
MTAPRSRALILLAVVLVALNMRGAIAAVPPLIDDITSDLGISLAGAALLVSLPVLFFAVAAPVAAFLGRRLGAGHAVLVGLALIAVGTAGRVLGGTAVLFLGTALLGLGITIANILVPAVIKRDFGVDAGRVTGYFVATMAVGATLTSALAVPLAGPFGWRAALAFWTVLVPLAMIGWWVHVTRDERTGRERERRAAHTSGVPVTTLSHRDGFVWRVPLAWALAVALGSQAALYFSLTAWLPSILIDRAGVSAGVAGVALSVYQIAAIPTALTIAGLCRMRRTQGWIGALIALSWIGFVVGLLLAPALWPLWAVVGGLAQGAGFTYVLTLIVLRGADEHAVRALGAMAQLLGYTIGAIGPFAVGWLAQSTGDWIAPAALLVALAVTLGLTSLVAGRDETVHSPVRS